MFSCKVDARTELKLLQRHHAAELFQVIDNNRNHLRPWHPWINLIRSHADLDKFISFWLQKPANNQGFYAGIWHDGKLCGGIVHNTIDWLNRSTALSYWLDQSHQGRGIMTAAGRAIILHAFNVVKLHRVTIQCAVTNARSRRVAERLGFQFEGIVRGVEWLNDHYADHAMYGLLKEDTIHSNVAIEHHSETKTGNAFSPSASPIAVAAN